MFLYKKKIYFKIRQQLFIEFKNQTEVNNWAYKSYSQWFPQFLAKKGYIDNYGQKNSNLIGGDPIEMYTGTSYNLNNYLRHQFEYCETNKFKEKVVNEIEAEIASVPSIKNNIIVYRHVPRSVADDLLNLNSKKMFYQEKAFLSTSITKISAINAGFDCPKDDIMLKIYVPKGTTCFPCDLLDSEFKRSYHNKTWNEPYENEFLFKHGLHFALIDQPFYDPEIHKMTYPVFMVNNIKEVDLNNPLFKLGLMKLNLF